VVLFAGCGWNWALQRSFLQGQKLSTLMRAPPAPTVGDFVRFEHFWLEAGPLPRPEAEEGGGADGAAAAAAGGGGTRFVQTPTVRRHLANLARAVMMRRYPVLLQVMHPSVHMPAPTLGFLILLSLAVRAALASSDESLPVRSRALGVRSAGRDLRRLPGSLARVPPPLPPARFTAAPWYCDAAERCRSLSTLPTAHVWIGFDCATSVENSDKGSHVD